MGSLIPSDLIKKLKKTLQDGTQNDLANGSFEENEMSQTKKSKFSDQTAINQNDTNNLKTEDVFEQKEMNINSKRKAGKMINAKRLGMVMKQVCA